MRLKHDIHLAYCTNIHRGENWEETFAGLSEYTDQVRLRVSPESPFGLGLRLSAEAAHELRHEAGALSGFRAWMDEKQSYVFTINGFPYGTFHGSRVKEQVYAPDWTTPERLDYTNGLFDLMDEMAPEGEAISVSTLPGSFKEFISRDDRDAKLGAIVANLRACSDHIERVRERSGRDVHLGMEPEPLGLFETSAETVAFFERLHEGLRAEESERMQRNIGVNYDTCHLAIEFEEPAEALGRLRGAGIRISKVHLSSALRLKPTAEAVSRLAEFQDEVYLHQVIVRSGDAITQRFRDLPDALEWRVDCPEEVGDEWRVHFHVPLHQELETGFGDTKGHIEGLMDVLASDPSWCHHFEMETYTWEVLPEEMRSRSVVDQLVDEYAWCLQQFRQHGLG